VKAPAESRSGFTLIPTLFIILLFLCGGCAKVAYPPGGPEDTTPPDVFAVTPESGTVNVPLDTDIRIQFSEAIKKESAPKALFISPRIDPEPKIKIKGDAIIISPEENLKPDRTYVVTIGTDLRDAHGVKLDQSISLAFSTGDAIDQGMISGRIYRDNKGARGLNVALFESDPNTPDLPIDSVSPAYVTQSGEDGLYTFEYLPPGNYFLAAFEDKNKDRRINPVREMIGIPFKTTALDSLTGQLSGIDLRMFAFDTTVVGLRSVTINPDRLLKVRFSHPLDSTEAGKLLATAQLAPVADTTDGIPLNQYIPLGDYPASDFIYLNEPLTAEVEYALSYDRAAVYRDLDDSVRFLTYSFSVAAGSDEAPPVLLSSQPAAGEANIDPASDFAFIYSEPVRTTDIDRLVMLVDSAGDTSNVRITQTNPFMLSGQPKVALDYGKTYNLIMAVPSMFDRAGNAMGDSVMEFSFSTVGADTAGSLSGEIVFATKSPDQNAAIVLDFQPAREGVSHQITLPAGQTTFATDLLPGYYVIAAFIDRNNNGKYDYGSLTPYQLAEPFTASSDTVRVRTRFESSGAVITF
jgi:uncharacterized protein (DUF2141 family)